MADRLIFQFCTTRWKDGGRGVRAFVNSMRLHWENKASWVIRKMCHSPFSHVDLVGEGGNLLGASSAGAGSPIIKTDPPGNPNGVALRPPDYQEFGYRRQMIIKTPLADRIYARARTQLGKPFDQSALYNFLSSDFPNARDWRDTGKWFCAELGIWSEEKEGYFDKKYIALTEEYTGDHALDWPKGRVSPTDLLIVHLTDPNWINKDTFWEPIPNLKLPTWES